MTEDRTGKADTSTQPYDESAIFIRGVAQTRKNFNEAIIAPVVKSQAVLEAFKRVDRKDFVPDDFKMFAYSDEGAIQLGERSSITQASLTAEMVSLLELKTDDRVLEVGTASGYTAAVLSQIASHVDTIEIDKELSQEAKKKLSTLGYTNVDVYYGDGAQGLPEKAPFDAILVTASAKEMPAELVGQLAQNGRIVAPIGTDIDETHLAVGKKVDGKLIIEKHQQVWFLPLISQHPGGWASEEEFEKANKPITLSRKNET